MSTRPLSPVRPPTGFRLVITRGLCRSASVLLALLVLPLFPGQAIAGEAPEVFHSPTLDGQPPTASPFTFSTGGGPNTLDLWIETGPTATASGPQVMCVNALGDELCGWLLEIETTGGITISGFTPEATLPAGHPIRFHTVSDTRLRIIRVNASLPAAGDLGTLRIGSLSLQVAGDGEVRIGGDSEAIDASGRRVAVLGNPIAVPEPAIWLGVGAGLLLLVRLPRRNAIAPLVVGALGLALGVGVPDASAQLYLDTDGDGQAFRNAVGDAPVSIEDFESFPVDGNGHAAISHGYDFGEFTYTHKILVSDVPLDGESGAPTGLSGTSLILDATSIGSRALSPGGYGGAGEDEASDSIEIVFDTPKAAVSFQLSGNVVNLSERYFFYDEFDNVLASGILPPGPLHIGWVSVPPANPIKRFTTSETSQDDDILIDDIQWADEVDLPDPPVFVPRARLGAWTQVGPNLPEFPAPPEGPGVDDRMGLRIAALGDLNRDSVPDYLATSSVHDGGGPNQGAAWTILMERDGSPRSVRAISDVNGFLSGPTDPGGYIGDFSRFGFAASAIGNLDDDPDGTTDVAIGAVEAGFSAGALYVVFLTPQGEVRAVQRIDENEGAGAVGGLAAELESDDWFGAATALVGDIDGDGRPELAVGARKDDGGGVTNSGAVYLLSLNRNGTYDLFRKLSMDEPSLAAGLSLASGDEFGGGLVALGDLDLDGVPDLAVGSPWRDVPRLDDPLTLRTDSGDVHVLLLNADGTVKEVRAVPPPEFMFYDSALWAVQDGAGYGHDLAWIPTPRASTPGILAIGMPYFGPIDPVSAADYGSGAVNFATLDYDGSVRARGAIFRVPQSSGFVGPVPFDPLAGADEGLGHGVSYLGDLDLDGFPELAAGAFLATVGGEASVGNSFVFSLRGTDGTAFGDAIAAQSGGISGAGNMVGPPDDDSTVITEGASITLQFVDNIADSDGGPAADLRIYRNDDAVFLSAGATHTLRIEASSTGANFTNLGDFVIPDNQVEIDVDLDESIVLGFLQDIRFIRLTMVDGCVPPLGISGLCRTLFEPAYTGIELINSESLTFDSDFDGIVDADDNCITTPNPGQEDGDGDGYGDFCDVCPAISNPTQEVVCGDAESEFLELRYLGIEAGAGGASDRHLWQLDFLCGGNLTTEAGGGFVVPPGIDPATIELGGGVNPGPPLSPGATCGNPLGNTGPISDPGAPIGCLNAAPGRIGARVDPLRSGVIFPAQADAMGGLANTLYFDLEAFDLVNGWCNLTDERVFLGLLSAEVGSNPDPSARLTGVGALSVGVPNTVDKRSTYESSLTDPVIDVQLSPAVGEPPGSETRFDLCFQSDQRLMRLTLNVIGAPDDDTPGELRLEGCDDLVTSGPGASYVERLCSGNVAPTVSEASAFTHTFGPLAFDGRDSNLVVQLDGAVSTGFPPQSVLNYTVSEPVCVGQIVTTTPGVVPVVTRPPDPPTIPDESDLLVLGAGGVVEPVDSGDAQWDFSETYNAPDDLDGDLVRDESDNCQFRYNPDQANSGGLLSDESSAGPLGDTCECGDLNFSGRIYASEAGYAPDLEVMQDVVLGAITDPDTVSRCSVSEGTECTLLDAVLLDAALGGTHGVSLSASCADAIPPPLAGP